MILAWGALLLMAPGWSAEPETLGKPAPNDSALAIDALLTQTFDPSEPGAAVIVTQAGGVLLRKGYGVANLEWNIPIQPDMVFRIGSITKQFTAAGILMLARDQKLALEDPIAEYVPEFPAHGATITIEHLLTHTSGIPDHTSLPGFWEATRDDQTVAQVIDTFKEEPLEFPPGAQWHYSNSGYILLGAIIEHVSGESYGEFIRSRVFEPFGMAHSQYDDASAVILRRVTGYKETESGFENIDFFNMSHSYAAGALLASVDDLAQWDRALYDSPLLDHELLKKAFTPFRLNDGSECPYGYGWEIQNYKGRKTLRHSGSIPGFTSYAMRIPEAQLFIAILANTESIGRRPTDLSFRIADLVLEK